MLKEIKNWDIKITQEMVDYYKELKKTGGNYFYKLNKEQAKRWVEMLCAAYEISVVPKILVDKKALASCEACGLYVPSNQTIYMNGRSHILTIIHEFYHHLDNITGGKYDSSDAKQYASAYSHKMYDELRTMVYGKPFKTSCVVWKIEETPVEQIEQDKRVEDLETAKAVLTRPDPLGVSFTNLLMRGKQDTKFQKNFRIPGRIRTVLINGQFRTVTQEEFERLGSKHCYQF